MKQRKEKILQEAEAFAESNNWSGCKKGGAQYKVFLALIECCRRTGNADGIFRASGREVAELSGVCRNTVASTLKDIQTPAHGMLIKRAGKDASPRNPKGIVWRLAAFRWEFTASITVDSSDGAEPLRLTNEEKLMLQQGSLGLAGVKVIRILRTSAKPLNKRQIAAMAQVTYHQVCYAMEKLNKMGLICKRGQQVSIPTEQRREIFSAVNADFESRHGVELAAFHVNRSGLISDERESFLQWLSDMNLKPWMWKPFRHRNEHELESDDEE